MSCIESRYEMRLLCKWSNSLCCALLCVDMIIVAGSNLVVSVASHSRSYPHSLFVS